MSTQEHQEQGTNRGRAAEDPGYAIVTGSGRAPLYLRFDPGASGWRMMDHAGALLLTIPGRVRLEDRQLRAIGRALQDAGRLGHHSGRISMATDLRELIGAAPVTGAG